MILLSGIALLSWVYLLLGHGRFWQAGPSLAPCAGGGPDIDVVIPARDEAAGIGATLGSLLAQQYAGRIRIFVVDDGSMDGTGDLARTALKPSGTCGLREEVKTAIAACAANPHPDALPRKPVEGVVLDGLARPAGWSGKLWAVSQGIARSTAPLILITDADILHDPLHIATLVAKAEADGLDLVSEMVELRCISLAERALVPAFVYFFQMLFPFARANNPADTTAAAAGGTMLIRRQALERIGGIDAISGALIDDVALAAAVKQGGRIWLGHSQLARSIRPYPVASDIWRMVARTAYVYLRFSPWILGGTVLGLALVWLVPPAVALLGHGMARVTAGVTWGLSALSFVPSLQRFRLSPLWALALPGIASFYLAATIGSAFDHHRGRGVQWKRRAYSGVGA